MKRVLIVGAKGMLGQEMAKLFIKSHELFAWDLDDIDITKISEVNIKLSVLSPDVIINCAAYNNVDKAEEELEIAILLNGRAVSYLAEVANKMGAILVHFSSDYVFDGKNKEGYKEDDTPNPISAYGKSKLVGEDMAKIAQKHYIIRLSRLFGNMGSGAAVKKSFVDIMLELGKVKNELDIVDEELSSPTYAPDLAKAVKFILENNLPFGIYHSSNSGACTWKEFSEEIFRLANLNVKINSISGNKFSRLAKRPMYSVLLNSKLPAMRSWQNTLEEYLK